MNWFCSSSLAYSSSVPLPIAVAGWSSGLPPLGCDIDTKAFQFVCMSVCISIPEVDIVSYLISNIFLWAGTCPLFRRLCLWVHRPHYRFHTYILIPVPIFFWCFCLDMILTFPLHNKNLQPPKPLLSKPLRKRCATHHHIACNIYLHQQLTKMNQFWPAGAGFTSLCGTKPKNLNVMPPAENMVIGSSLLGNFPCVNLSHSQEKGQDVGNFPGHSGKDKSSGPANLMETSQRKQIVLSQTPQPASAINGMVWLCHLLFYF